MVEGRSRMGIPRTVDQSVSIVREYSYNVSVNPKTIHEQTAETEIKFEKGETEQEPTVYFVIILHKEERVEIYVTVILHTWPARGSVRSAGR